MSERQRSVRGVSTITLAVLLAVLAAAALAGFLCLFISLGLLRAGGEQAAGDSQPPGSSTQPFGGANGNSSTNSTDERPGPKGTWPATRAANGAEPPGDAGVAEPPPPPPSPAPVLPAVRRASASLVRVDDQSRGGWVGQYGKRGYFLAMAGATPHLPPGVEITMDRGQFYPWSPLTTDPRGLSTPETPDRFSAGQWFAWDHFSLDLDLRRTNREYRVALYLLDWDSDARVQRLDVVDAESGAILLSRTDEHFRDGRYVVLRLSGHVVLRFTRVGGANCTLSGVFLDDPPDGASR